MFNLSLTLISQFRSPVTLPKLIPRQQWCWMIPLFLLLALLGASRLDGVLWTDEIMSLYRAGDMLYGAGISPLDVWQRTAEVYDQVPGYYLLLWAWGQLLGLDPIVARLLSLLLGLLAVACVYRLGRDLHSPLVGFAAVLLLGIDGFFINYLHDMRAYTLIVLLTAVLLLSYWHMMLRGKTNRWLAVGVVASTTGLLYTHYFSVVLIAALCLYHLLFVRKDRRWWHFTGCMVLAGMLFAPWLLTSFTATTVNTETAKFSALSAGDLLRELLYGFSGGSGALWLLLSFSAWRGRGKAAYWLLFLLAATLGAALAINAWLGVLAQIRYLIMLWLPMALIGGLGIVRLARIGISVRLMLSFGLLFGVWSSIDPQFDQFINPEIKYLPWDRLAQIVIPQAQTGDVLAFTTLVEGWDGNHLPTVNYYFSAAGVDVRLVESLPLMEDADYIQRATQTAVDAERVWLSYAPKVRPWRMGMFERVLDEQGFAQCGAVLDSQDLYLALYTRPPQSITAVFDAGEASTAMHLITPLETGQNGVRVTLSWVLDALMPREMYSAGIHLVDSAGQLVMQSDYGLPSDGFGCTMTTLAVDGLPHGDYSVKVVVYAWQTGERLTLMNSSDDAFVLGTVRLE